VHVEEPDTGEAARWFVGLLEQTAASYVTVHAEELEQAVENLPRP